MNDMSSTIVAKSDQINAADLVGTSRTVTVREVKIKPGEDQPVSILIEGDNKAFRPCKGVRRLLVRVWGADASKYVGQSMTLFCDPKVTWAGKEEGGIRISHMTGIDGEIIEHMRVSRAATRPYKILPLKTEPREDEAAKWADKFTATVARAPDAEKLEQYLSGQGGTLERLKQQRPELHAACETAIENARSSFTTWGEGPSDTDRGEAHTADPATLRKQIDEATDRESWKAAENAVGAADLTDEQRLELSHALTVKLDELRGDQ